MVPIVQIGESRDKDLPNVPLCSELPNLAPEAKSKVDFITHQIVFNRVLAAPPGMDPARLEFLREAIKKALNDPELLEMAEKQKRPVMPASGPAVAEAVKSDLQMSAELKGTIKKALDKYR